MMLAAGLAVVLPRAVCAQPAGGTAMAIDEGLFADINGMEQWITIRGRDRRNPALLILHGGPGFPMSFMAPVFAAWEEHYTLVQWDQPGGGATYLKNAARGQGPLTVARYVEDGIAVTEFVRDRLDVEKVVLMGASWGTMLGVMMVRRRPDLFAAYVGASQAVSGPEGARLGYRLALEAARARGDTVAIEALERVGPPPHARFEDFLVRQQYSNPPGLPPSPQEAAAGAAMAAIFSAPPPPDARYVARGLGPYDGPGVFLETQRATFAETWSWEARGHGMDFEMPILVIQGENDINAPVALARAWFDEIRAPAKAFEIIPGAGHNVLAFSDQVLALINRHIGPAVADAAAPLG
jgi:pimeloyl-ACP methyl ester carboxylesterase